MLRKSFFLVFLVIPFLLSSQNKSKLSPFFKAVELKSEALTVNKDLSKARQFFLQKKWDSTILYSAKYIDSDFLERQLADYAYFFKAYSLRKKKIFEQAGLEFDKISEEFDFYERVFFYQGSIALELKEYKIAITNFQRALDSIDSEAMIRIRLTTINNNLGICYLHLEEYDKADQYLLKNVKIVEERKDTMRMIGVYANLANLYYSRKLDDKAIPYFKRAYDLAYKADNYELKRNSAKNMAAVEENRKDYAKALKYRKEYEQWKDSLNDQNRIYETAQLEKKIAVEQKEKEVQVLEAENKAKEAQNRVYLYSGILLGVLLIIVFVSYKGTAKRNKIITAQKEDLDALNATKDKLFSIVSHDLRSSVNAIKTSNKKLLTNLETQDKQEITTSLQQNSAIVNSAYGLLDNLLNWALLQTKQTYFEMMDLSLYHIVAHVAFNYQPILQEKDIAYVNSISRKTQVFADQESLKIILRNLLDNAIKFSEENGKIHVYSEESEEGYVDLVVEDSGLGMDEETKKELLKDTQLLSKKKHEDSIGTGLGMHLVKSMIAKNQGKFNIESELGEGTKMIVSLKKMEAV
jgi:signal transduction histidine kinase